MTVPERRGVAARPPRDPAEQEDDAEGGNRQPADGALGLAGDACRCHGAAGIPTTYPGRRRE